jgi:hypothetical protein
MYGFLIRDKLSGEMDFLYGYSYETALRKAGLKEEDFECLEVEYQD